MDTDVPISASSDAPDMVKEVTTSWERRSSMSASLGSTRTRPNQQ